MKFSPDDVGLGDQKCPFKAVIIIHVFFLLITAFLFRPQPEVGDKNHP